MLALHPPAPPLALSPRPLLRAPARPLGVPPVGSTDFFEARSRPGGFVVPDCVSGRHKRSLQDEKASALSPPTPPVEGYHRRTLLTVGARWEQPLPTHTADGRLYYVGTQNAAALNRVKEERYELQRRRDEKAVLDLQM